MASGSPELNIVLFNTHSSDKDKNNARVPARVRLTCMDAILDSIITKNYPNLFILAQEEINGPKHEKLCERMHQNSTSVRFEKEAGVYYNTETNTHYDVEYVDVADLQQANDALVLEAGNVFTVARLTACVLTPKAGVTTGKKILLVSWHGPSKRILVVRQACFNYLVRVLERLKVQNDCDMVIVGGDFNLRSGEARGMLGAVDGAVLDDYTPTVDRPNGDPKDYVVYWPRDGLQLTAPVYVEMPHYMRKKGERPFDHNIIVYRLTEIEIFSDVARRLRNITVYSLEKIESFSDWARRLRKMFMYNSDKIESYSDWVRQLRRITV